MEWGGNHLSCSRTDCIYLWPWLACAQSGQKEANLVAAKRLKINAHRVSRDSAPGGEPLCHVPQRRRMFFPVRGRPKYEVKQAAPANDPGRRLCLGRERLG